MGKVKGFRFPEELRIQIEELAKKERRDFSKQVFYLIEKGIERYYKEEGWKKLGEEMETKQKKGESSGTASA